MSSIQTSLSDTLNRNLLFVHGKGGVGKTVISQAIARHFSQTGAKVLWITIEDPTLSAGDLVEVSHSLWHLNCSFKPAFEEYMAMKVGALSRLFLKNRLIFQMANVAPGIHELVLLGKIWFERLRYSHVIVDLPSTGYGLALFQSTENFTQLFQTGPLHRDAAAMIETFSNPSESGHLIIALPEEMPLREALDLNDFLSRVFPQNPAAFLANRLFPLPLQTSVPPQTNAGTSRPPETEPLAHSMEDYILRRILLENDNLRIWREKKIEFGRLDFIPQDVIPSLARQLHDRKYL